MDLGLSGKTAIVTGGSGGIGRGLLLEFAREGVNVVSASRDPATGAAIAAEAVDRKFEGRILPIATDVTRRESVDAMVETARREFGPVSILVNNAGGVARPSAFEELDVASRDWEIALNVNGVVNCSQAVAKDMLSAGGGSIINISSNAALLGEAAYTTAHYAAAKGFVVSLTRALAYEWGARNVRVNTIAPGWIVPHDDEQMGPGSFWNRFGKKLIGKPSEMTRAMEEGKLFNMSTLPLRRLGRPEDIAFMALFLASEKASYVTGQLISVGGGAWMG